MAKPRLRTDRGDTEILDGSDDRRRAERIADRLKSWKSYANS